MSKKKSLSEDFDYMSFLRILCNTILYHCKEPTDDYTAAMSLDGTLQRIEEVVLTIFLSRYKTKTEAARMLGMNRTTLVMRAKRYGL